MRIRKSGVERGMRELAKKIRYLRSPGVGNSVLLYAISHFDTSVFNAIISTAMSEFDDIFRLFERRLAKPMNVRREFIPE